ncbi:MAG: acireductone synthase [Acidobacteria bacterium]|nr:acireductone synthase [Acidobacteriota bacterium]
MTASTILLDIEGTTTPIDFVYKVLFPYARAHVGDFLARHADDEEVRAAAFELLAERAKDEGQPQSPSSAPGRLDESRLETVATYARRLIDEDRKLTPLKTIQGRIWEEGYRRGELKGQVFPDVERNLRRWREEGRTTCIYSSGSVLAQKLLFANTEAGDLTELIEDFFDTKVGHKTDPLSYLKIAELLPRRPAEVLFVSDVVAELDAAAGAGFQTRLCVRPGNHPQPDTHAHAKIRTLDEVKTEGV